MNRKMLMTVCGLMIVMALSLFAGVRDSTDRKKVNLSDLEWTITKIRSEDSVKRHPATCAFLWGPDKEEFKPDEGTLCVVTIILTPRKMGRLRLTPEFFLMSAGDNYRLCQGVRVVTPKPRCGDAFFPPSGGSGLEIYCQDVTVDQPIVIELVFAGKLMGEEQILAVAPAVRVAGFK